MRINAPRNPPTGGAIGLSGADYADTMADVPRLYGYDLSHYVVAAERMLSFKGIRHRRVPVTYHDKRELLRATGQDYVPALVWDGHVVTWKQIPDFLERKVRSPTIFPVGSDGVARALENWAHEVVEERVWRCVAPKMPATFSDPVERWVFEELQIRGRGPLELLARRRPEFRRDLMEYLAIAERMLDGKEYLLGSPSVGDFALYGSLSPLCRVGDRIPPKYARLTAWYGRIRRIRSTAARTA